MRLHSLMASLMTGVLVAAAPSPATSPLMDPITIYERCIAMMDADQMPQYAIYTLHTDAQHIDISRIYTKTGATTTLLHFGTFNRQNAYRVWYRARGQRSVMQDLTSHAAEYGPPVPWALDLAAPNTNSGTTSGQAVGSDAVAIDDATQLLSDVRTEAKSAYRISLTGVEKYAGHFVYHLSLESVSGDPNDHPLRTLLVDTVSFQPLQLVIEVGQRTMLYGGGLTMSVSFGDVGGHWLSTSGSIVGIGRFAFIHVRGTYTYAVSDFLAPSQLPDSIFASQSSYR
jgi:hypothetical protein